MKKIGGKPRKKKDKINGRRKDLKKKEMEDGERQKERRKMRGKEDREGEE